MILSEKQENKGSLEIKNDLLGLNPKEKSEEKTNREGNQKGAKLMQK